jgi:hypothetical protein
VAKQPPILRLRLTGLGYVFLGLQCHVAGLGRTGEMGRLQEPRKLAKSCAGSWQPSSCWQSTVSKGPVFEAGERETWNISITDLGEQAGSGEQGVTTTMIPRVKITIHVFLNANRNIVHTIYP